MGDGQTIPFLVAWQGLLHTQYQNLLQKVKTVLDPQSFRLLFDTTKYLTFAVEPVK